jgi:GNAT superfamily N-acetyltransferase
MISIRLMTSADLPLGLSLSRRAGWNQTPADWQRALELQPDGCFVAEWQGAPVGTTTTCIFGDVAWIAMVLVEESLRGRGIGTALVNHALAFLSQRRVASVRLDATPLGSPLYKSLGFVEQFPLARYEGTLPPGPRAPESLEIAAADWESLAALDEAISGANRRSLLLRLFAEQPAELCAVWHSDRPIGFLTARPGSRAIQLGPCLASGEAGPLLLAHAWQRHAGQRVYLDIPVAHEAARRAAEAQGLTVQRHLMRMCRGTPRRERIDWLWMSFGPEKG